MRLITMTGLALALAATTATAKPSLRDVAEIDDGLLAVALADEIRKTCDDISPRLVRAYSYITALENRAKELGYTEDEIEDHVTSKTEKARMRQRGEAYLKARGVAPDDKAALCALGKQEIAKGSQIGALLRAR
ncbi:DUF5333 domain-containing protein [Thalassococcus sp. BH17M4-6]|uniref:DUF5333 domain-containing protein n=1 Tax=Thalassococcus sp. BH17M4-6 TaxID=3413148 RepID=UPI003BC7A6A0